MEFNEWWIKLYKHTRGTDGFDVISSQDIAYDKVGCRLNSIADVSLANCQIGVTIELEFRNSSLKRH